MLHAFVTLFVANEIETFPDHKLSEIADKKAELQKQHQTMLLFQSNIKLLAEDINSGSIDLDDLLNVYEANTSGKLAVIRGSIDSLMKEVKIKERGGSSKKGKGKQETVEKGSEEASEAEEDKVEEAQAEKKGEKKGEEPKKEKKDRKLEREQMLEENKKEREFVKSRQISEIQYLQKQLKDREVHEQKMMKEIQSLQADMAKRKQFDQMQEQIKSHIDLGKKIFPKY